MKKRTLTAALLRDFSYDLHADARTLQRGRAYYQKARVVDIELPNSSTALCQVSGDSGDYEVEIRADSSEEGLDFSCDCPHADAGNFCKHMVAAGLDLADLLAENDDFDDIDYDREVEVTSKPRPVTRPAPAPARARARKWQNQVGQVLGAALPRSHAARVSPYVGLVILERSDYYNYNYGAAAMGGEYALTPYVIRAAEWPALASAEPTLSPLAINALLAADPTWLRFGQPLTQMAASSQFMNLDAQAAAFLNLLRGFRTAYDAQLPGGYLPLLLARLAQLAVPLFKGSTRSKKIEQRLQVLPDPVNIVIDLSPTSDGITLLPGIEQGEAFLPVETPALMLSHSPVWVVLGGLVAQLPSHDLVNWLGSFPIHIPAQEAEAFREQYFAGLAERLPLRRGAVEWRDVHAEPVPRLYLRDDRATRLSAQLRFGYGDHELPPIKIGEPISIVAVPDAWALLRIHRSREREDASLQNLATADYGLKRAAAHLPYGTFALRARAHPFDFLLHTIPRLAQAGFEVYGEESLKIGKINRSTPTLRVSITSGIDWFDLKAVVEFGDQQISLQAVRKALQRGERFIKLADGSAGQLPAEWLEKSRHLWEMATETQDGYRVSDTHLSLLDSLLETDTDIRVPADLHKRRNRLRSFEHIQPQPLPTGFTGELRPYQKHGLDWLHFLYDYKLGGILADDMGLGKTIQVLAFLQLLKERSPRRKQAATLLVVPKSLIANWQREAAKFTPGLRVMLYLGAFRSKDTSLFQGQDVVLTTYGTMLRDIDQLRHYRFRCVILDESQAIKNPLAQSAKAARLLQAEHRLVLTGTPVENNSIELWSQFAFLNPGLLGSLDYFRRAFALPIEARGDEAAAATLRGLVYPFILRRTKAQVAPELPPRTERILYADMHGAQRKLYERTRARYQAELLNLIDNEGLNDARFKILEGLLRLRQIAIHPRLMEARYQGGAPKLELLLETLETLQSENHKVLVFSQFVGMLKLVRHELDARGLKYLYLDGRTNDRQKRVDKFQNDPAYPFFLISLKAGGVGLNLTAADYVIHLDPWWNPAVEMQASDRAHRIGQDKPVFIYKLIVRDTVEEKILQLQEKKRALVASLVTTEAGFFKALSKDDVRQLFG